MNTNSLSVWLIRATRQLYTFNSRLRMLWRPMHQTFQVVLEAHRLEAFSPMPPVVIPGPPSAANSTILHVKHAHSRSVLNHTFLDRDDRIQNKQTPGYLERLFSSPEQPMGVEQETRPGQGLAGGGVLATRGALTFLPTRRHRTGSAGSSLRPDYARRGGKGRK